MSDRPNVLWLVADHLIHANHGPAIGRLPLQAHLAKRGAQFTRAYTPLPICSPARASMLTGLYPHAHGLSENDGRFGGRAGLDQGDWLIQHAFQDQGYRCAWFGKWHLDNAADAGAYGFAGWSPPGYGYPYSSDAYADCLQRRQLTRPVAEIEIPGESGLARGTKIDLCDAPDWFDFEAGTAIFHGVEQCHEAWFLADLAANWLTQHGAEPFFMRVDPWGPHPPYIVDSRAAAAGFPSGLTLSPNCHFDLTGRPEHHRDYRDEWRDLLGHGPQEWRHMMGRAYQQAAIVERALLHVVQALERLGLSGNTIIIYTADHGDAVGSNGGVCNKGGLMVEETMRVPLCIAGPGMAAGVSTNALVSTLDLVPTLAQSCGLTTSQDFHGEDLNPILRGKTQSVRDGLMAQHNGLHTHLPQRAYYQEQWKYVVQQDGFEELYNLAEDPAEMRNLVNNSQYSATRDGMRINLQHSLDKADDNFAAIPE